jgi:hypothetical protein
MPKHLGSLIHESSNLIVWYLVNNIVSHTSQRLFNNENESHYICANMIPEAGLMNSSFNMITTATLISLTRDVKVDTIQAYYCIFVILYPVDALLKEHQW